MEVYSLFAALVLLPALSALLCLIIPVKLFRQGLILLTTLVMVTASLLLALAVRQAGGHLSYLPHAHILGAIGWAVKAIDLAVLCYVIVRGLSSRRFLSPLLAIIQLVALISFEVWTKVPEPKTPIVIDYLSLVLILLASLIGPAIMIFGMGYMDVHEEHLHLGKSRQPRFFAILFLFLGVMNALSMSDNLLWMYTFWEVTTLCSFLLIEHDGTLEAIRNAFRTLDINMLGGVAFILAIIIICHGRHTVSLSEICAMRLTPGVTGLFAVGIMLLCFAGFTKSAQFPFQSWLLGAMVAPTPVSALLHSSTMVKAGVYLVVRLSPVLAGSLPGSLVALAGGFTFLAASAIAISQQNGKRVLAYSTIANLGLIVCCAGIGTQAALGAAILLIIFHAVSKGLLFLCIGTIEQGIGSRDIEDMQGLLKKMPFTTFVTVIGMMSMLLPPFGVLITKWLALESAVQYPGVLMLIILGSAFTVVVWAKWIGILLTMSYKAKYNLEPLRFSMRSMLCVLLLGVVAASCAIAPLYNWLIAPQLHLLALSQHLTLSAGSGGLWLTGKDAITSGGFFSVPLFITLFALVFAIPYFFHITQPEKVKPPYFGGELANHDIRGIDFMAPGEKVEQIVVHNYYLTGIFGEHNLTKWLNLVALGVLIIMFGVAV